MLPSRSRLRANEVKQILKQGKSLRHRSCPHLSIKYISAHSAFRAAAVVSKSVVRGAVERNRVRRALYRALQSVSIAKPAQVVFFVQRMPHESLTPLLRHEATLLLQSIS